jgi:hypothetical protein
VTIAGSQYTDPRVIADLLKGAYDIVADTRMKQKESAEREMAIETCMVDIWKLRTALNIMGSLKVCGGLGTFDAEAFAQRFDAEALAKRIHTAQDRAVRHRIEKSVVDLAIVRNRSKLVRVQYRIRCCVLRNEAIVNERSGRRRITERAAPDGGPPEATSSSSSSSASSSDS